MKKETERLMPDKRIASFFEESTNMTIATCMNNVPYCAHCFYAYDKTNNWLIFKSSPDTNHIKQARLNPEMAGTVAPDRLKKSEIKGIQFNGLFVTPEKESLERAEKVYYKKYPFARLFTGEFWLIELTKIKMTDNTLGFGKKIEWPKQISL